MTIIQNKVVNLVSTLIFCTFVAITMALKVNHITFVHNLICYIHTKPR